MEGLELRKTKSVFGEEYLEIVQWYKNTLYGKEEDYIKQPNGLYKHLNFEFYVHKNIFEQEYSCYTVCYFIYNRDKDEVELKMVDDRLLNDDVDWIRLRVLIKEGFEKSKL